LKTLKQLCKPRPSVFDPSKRDIVLDLSDLIENRITADEFFEENYMTDGMQTLLREAFRRFERKSTQGVFKLTQAMGGGKTHNLLVLGLLAKNPKFRKNVMGSIYESKDLGPVRVVAFSGRESDAPYGIWGSIAEQLNKKEVFKDYYSPLSAPGQTAWINLLKGEPLLILLDELPPYFEYAKSKTIGNSDLSEVTTTALSNLLVAVGKDELSNVCVVISDLRATYQQGSSMILKAIQNLEAEIGRSALSLEPVGMNTEELYHILRKRLFETTPAEKEIKEVAQGYAKAVKDAK
jgi:predicted AAA+ superfamily ATPase